MYPVNQRIHDKPGQQEQDPELRQIDADDVEARHGALTHRTHQVMQAQREGSQHAKDSNGQEDVENGIDNEKARDWSSTATFWINANRTLRINHLSQLLLANKSVEDQEDEEHDRTDGDQQADNRRCSSVSTVGVALLARGKNAKKYHRDADGHDSRANHDKIDDVYRKP